MAAIDALLTRLESGDHVVVSDNTYGGTFRLFERVRRKFGLDFTYVDTSQLGADRAGDHSRTRSTCSSRRRPTRCCTITDIAARERDRAPQERPRRSSTTRSPAPTSSGRSTLGADIVAAQHHEVPQRPQRQRRRHRHPQAPGRCGVDEVRAERGRRDPRADGFVAGPARHQDADRSAWSAPTPTRRRIAEYLGGASEGEARRSIPGLQVASASRPGAASRCAASAG